jgi:O-antigen ligase
MTTDLKIYSNTNENHPLVNKKIKKYYGYAVMLVAATMPYASQVSSGSIILLAFMWLLEGNFTFKWKLFKQRPLVWVFCLFYILFLAGMLYTANVSTGKFELEKKMSLFALPLIIGTSISFDYQMKEKALIAFVLSCLAASFVCLGNALFHYFSTAETSYFLHEELASVVDLQPVYFGMFSCFSILIVLFYLWANKITFSYMQKLLMALLAFFFFIFIVLLSARTTMVFILLLFVTGGFYFFYKVRQLRTGSLTFFAVVSFAFILVANSPYLKDRIVRPLTTDINIISGGRETGLSIRIVKWKCSLEGILENPFVGVGTGDAVDYLISCYERVNFWGYLLRYNSHNQYLQTALTLGFIGLTCFLCCLIIPLVYAWRQKQFLFLSFVLLFAFCCLTESLLERQWGIVFFTFFISIFHFRPKKE